MYLPLGGHENRLVVIRLSPPTSRRHCRFTADVASLRRRRFVAVASPPLRRRRRFGAASPLSLFCRRRFAAAVASLPQSLQRRCLFATAVYLPMPREVLTSHETCELASGDTLVAIDFALMHNDVRLVMTCATDEGAALLACSYLCKRLHEASASSIDARRVI